MGATFRFTKQVLRDTFFTSSFQREKEQLETSFVTKAWITHIIMMVSRVVYPLFGIAYWQKAYKNYEKNDVINREFAVASEPYVKLAIVILIVLGVILDIAVWRRRHLGKFIIYYELVSLILQNFLPVNMGDFDGLILMMFVVFTNILTACSPKANMIASTATVLFIEFFCFPLVFNEHSGAVANLINAFFTFFLLTILSMMTTYLA